MGDFVVVVVLDFVGCLSLSVAGNMFVAIGACLLETVTQCRFFLFFGGGLLMWWRHP